MEFITHCKNFEMELQAINVFPTNILEKSTLAINLCRSSLQFLKTKILKEDFDNKMEEINFFKNIKQNPLIPLIYYSEIRSFEIQFPKGNIECQRKYTKNKIKKMNRFFLYNIDFEQYVDSQFTHFDTQYYTREFLETYHIISCKFYFQDPDFSTSRDMLLGKIKAYSMFIDYLKNRIAQIEGNTSGNHSHNSFNSKLKWTASKAALTELIYALHTSGAINSGSIQIKELASMLEEIFNIKLGNYYHTFIEIRARKKSKTKFMNKLTKSLNKLLEGSDE